MGKKELCMSEEAKQTIRNVRNVKALRSAVLFGSSSLKPECNSTKHRGEKAPLSVFRMVCSN